MSDCLGSSSPLPLTPLRTGSIKITLSVALISLTHKQSGLLVAQTVENLPAMQETRDRSLDQEDPLKKAMAAHSSILAWEIPWSEEPGGLYSPWGHRVGHD